MNFVGKKAVGMQRYVLFAVDAQAATHLADAGRIVMEHGAKVLAALQGALVVEADAQRVPFIMDHLTGWQHTLEAHQSPTPVQ